MDYKTFCNLYNEGITLDDLQAMTRGGGPIDVDYTTVHSTTVHSTTVHSTTVHSTDSDGWSPLFRANVASIPVLIKRGLDINHTSHQGSTALIIKSRNSQLEHVRELINNGADVNHQNIYGYSALLFAFDQCNFQIVELLLDAKAVYHGNYHTDNLVCKMHELIATNRQQLTAQTEQTKDLTMYRNFYELCNF